MLSISSPAKGAQRINYYVNSVFTEYYVGRGGIAAHWAGSGAELLGLYGTVANKTLVRLAKGVSPSGRSKLVQNANNPKRQCFWDMTFSAPKSVSVLWALAPEGAQKAIEDCHNRAVEHALQFAEAATGLTRRGRAGAQLEQASLVFSVFQHFTSRTLDPQLHSHALLMNVGVRPDGTTGSLWTNELFSQKLVIGAQYQQALRVQLWERLNVLTQDEKVAFSVNGVPNALCEELSKRGKQIRAKLDELGLDGAVAAKVAALDTRPKKKDVPLPELFALWRTAAQSHGWSSEQVRELFKPKIGQSQFQDQAPDCSHKPPKTRTLEASPRNEEKPTSKPAADGSKVSDDISPQESATITSSKARGKKQDEKHIKVEWLRPLIRLPFWNPIRVIPIPKIVVRFSKHQAPWGKILSQKNYLFFSVKRQIWHPFAQSPFRKLREYSLSVPRLGSTQKKEPRFVRSIQFLKTTGGNFRVIETRGPLVGRPRQDQRTLRVAKQRRLRHKSERLAWNKIRWEWDGKAGAIRLQNRALFPQAPNWIPGGKLSVPLPRFVSPNEAENEKRRKSQSQTQTR